MARHNELGKLGEEMAVRYLIKKGYEIRETNWRFQKAEIDIIAQIGNTLAVIEVKTRSNQHFGNPEDFVDSKKIKLLVKAIDQYVDVHKLDVEVRFDIISIIKNKSEQKMEHLEDAFFHF